MTCQEFDDALDELLMASAEAASVDELPAEMQRHAAVCRRCRQQQTDWLWLHNHVRRSVAPAPSAGFADQVVAAFVAETAGANCPSRQSARTSQTGFGSLTAWAGGIAAVAASLLLVFLLEPGASDRQVSPQLASTMSATPTLPLELPQGQSMDSIVRSVTDALVLAPSENDTTMSEVEPGPVTEFPDLGIRRAFRDSTGSLLSTSKELGSTIEPITKSAVGAFGFLWKDLAEAEKPRT